MAPVSSMFVIDLNFGGSSGEVWSMIRLCTASLT